MTALLALAAGGADRARRLRVAIALGRYREVAALQRELPAGDRLDPAAYRAFLEQRAMPQLPIGGDAERGFHVDQRMARDIAAELGEPVAALFARTARWMRARGSRHIAKLYVFARLGGDHALAAELQGEFDERAARPRRELVARLPGRVVEVLQEGDDDAYNPRSAHIWHVRLAGRDVVMKEHLRLAIDPSRVDGYSEEKESLVAAAGPHVVRLLGTLRLPPHEVLVLERVPGTRLSEMRPPPAVALRVLGELAATLERMHARDLVYLDLKPHNVLVDRERGATLVDFGMARGLRGAAEVTTLPSTPEYAPPEVAGELRAGRPADVFQLGLLARELLGPPGAGGALARAVDVDPARRPTVAELRVALEEIA